ncbi:MAG: methyltransferase domain-containing protein [Brachymonas sp.]|nr:methyltransferase domain-containing protein [Brachymonas sp.]
MPASSVAPSLSADLDPIAAQRWQRQRPLHSPWLHEEVAQRMLQRLDLIKLQPQQWLHWQAEQGGLQAHAALLQRYPQAQAWRMPAIPRARQPLASAAASDAGNRQPHAQQPPPGSIDLLWANLVLDKAPDPRATLAQWRRLLAPEGFVMFSVLGPASLQELRSLYRHKGWGAPCHAFADLHDWGDAVQQAGFADVVMDAERITLSFATPQRLLQELRELGRNLSSARSQITRGKGWLQAWHEAVQEALTQPDGQLHLSFEILYGHAVQGAQGRDEAGGVIVDLAHMRRMLLGRR